MVLGLKWYCTVFKCFTPLKGFAHPVGATPSQNEHIDWLWYNTVRTNISCKRLCYYAVRFQKSNASNKILLWKCCALQRHVPPYFCPFQRNTTPLKGSSKYYCIWWRDVNVNNVTFSQASITLFSINGASIQGISLQERLVQSTQIPLVEGFPPCWKGRELVQRRGGGACSKKRGAFFEGGFGGVVVVVVAVAGGGGGVVRVVRLLEE